MKFDALLLMRSRVGQIMLLAAALVVLWLGWSLITEGPRPTARINGSDFKVEVARSPDERTRGLSGRGELAAGNGMIFIFDTPAHHCFWMKDMRLNIDILWFSEARKLVHIERNVAPSTYPHRFCPSTDAKYVLEVPAGTADAIRAKTGDELFLSHL